LSELLDETMVPPQQAPNPERARILPHKPARVLHISDVHIAGNEVSSESEVSNTLWKRLFGLPIEGEDDLRAAQLLLLTGDLARSSPDGRVYDAIRNSLNRFFPSQDGRRRWLVLPGNHDRRKVGNFFLDSKTFESVFASWKSPWWHPEHALIVVPIDSNPTGTRDGDLSYARPLARGRIAETELERIGVALSSIEAEVEAHCASRLNEMDEPARARLAFKVLGAFGCDAVPGIRSIYYGDSSIGLPSVVSPTLARILTRMFLARAVKCVALHHHPVGIANTENIGLTHQDVYLALSNSGDFMATCRERDIDLVCHGHKHMPHRIVIGVPTKLESRESPRYLGIVGSGSTTVSGGSSHASGNVIDVEPSGRTVVTRVSPLRDGWGASEEKLVVRSVEQGRARMVRSAVRAAVLSCSSIDVDVRILDTGDAVVTRYYREVRFGKDHLRDGCLRFPVDVLAGGHGSVRAAVDIDEDHRHQIGSPRIEHDGNARPGQLRCFVVVPLQNTDLRPSITIRFTVFGAFSTNAWQSRCRYGEESDEESYSWTCSIPVTKRMSASVSTQDLIFGRPYKKCFDIEGGDDATEVEFLSANDSPGRDAIFFQVERPLWGWKYAVEWHWESNHAKRDAGAGLRRFRDAKHLDRNSASATKASDLLKQVAQAKGLELCVYALTEATGTGIPRHSATLTPFLYFGRDGGAPPRWFDVGVGIAGRAIWLREPILWATSGGQWTLDPDVDFYLPDSDDEGHAAVLAIPLGKESAPFGLLSVASSIEGNSFVEDSRRKLTGISSNLSWASDLAGELGSILAELGEAG
jgi:3',5'-cyclic AMP phosphodiesterase CpdA